MVDELGALFPLLRLAIRFDKTHSSQFLFDRSYIIVAMICNEIIVIEIKVNNDVWNLWVLGR